MKNMIADGKTLTVTASGTVSAGSGVLVGSAFGVAHGNATSGDPLVLAMEGVFELTKIGSQDWTVGAVIYWDDGNSRCTTVASTNTKIGIATEAVADGANDTLGKVRLNGAF